MMSFSDRKSLLGKFNGEACLTHHVGIQKAIKILESEKIESEILQWDSHHENHKYEKVVFCDLEDYSDLRVDFIEAGFQNSPRSPPTQLKKSFRGTCGRISKTILSDFLKRTKWRKMTKY